jgi:SWIM zinc finger
MNQLQIQEEKRKQTILEKAQEIAASGKVKKVGNNLWHVISSNEKTPGFVYDVMFDYTLVCFTCSCPHYQRRLEYCKHILACAFFEGTEKQE